MTIGILIALGAAAGVATATAIGVAARKGGRPKPPRGAPNPVKGCRFDPPIAVGYATEPPIAELLDEMDELFAAHGVDLELVTAREVTTMPKAPGQPVAIPPREWWPSMAYTLRWGFMPIREAIGIPLTVRGYRPPDYNEAVGGAECSRHQAFDGIDIYVDNAHASAANRRELGRLGAQLYADHGRELKVGFGAYGHPNPSNIHIDTGFERRTWREADRHIADVAAGRGPQNPLRIPFVA